MRHKVGLIPWTSGVVPAKDAAGKDIIPDLSFAQGGYIMLPGEHAKLDLLEPKGSAVASVENEREHIEQQMATIGARVLAPAKAAPESPETERIRNGAEDSALSLLSDRISRGLSKALTIASQWYDGTDCFYQLNKEFENRAMTAQERTVAMAEVQAGLMSRQTYFYERRDRGVVNSTLTPDEEFANIESDRADLPPTTV